MESKEIMKWLLTTPYEFTKKYLKEREKNFSTNFFYFYFPLAFTCCGRAILASIPLLKLYPEFSILFPPIFLFEGCMESIIAYKKIKKNKSKRENLAQF